MSDNKNQKTDNLLKAVRNLYRGLKNEHGYTSVTVRTITRDFDGTEVIIAKEVVCKKADSSEFIPLGLQFAPDDTNAPDASDGKPIAAYEKSTQMKPTIISMEEMLNKINTIDPQFVEERMGLLNKLLNKKPNNKQKTVTKAPEEKKKVVKRTISPINSFTKGNVHS